MTPVEDRTMRPTRARRSPILMLMIVCATVALATVTASRMAHAQTQAQNTSTYSGQEIIDAGHQFFGATSGTLATLVEKVFASYGLPNGYILGQEGGGAIVAGVSFGEGVLYTKNAGDYKVFWQGPSVGWDFGVDGSRTMMLVYNLQSVPALYRRFLGVSGSAFVVGGLGMTVLESNGIVLVPITTGVGARLGVNVGYLKLTPEPTWNPF